MKSMFAKWTHPNIPFCRSKIHFFHLESLAVKVVEKNCYFLITSFSKTNETVKCNGKTTIGDELNNFDDSSD